MIEEKLGNDLNLSFVYDSAGQLTQLTFPDQTAVEYEYQGSLLKKIIRKSENSYVFTCDRYDESSRLLEATLPGKAGKLIQTFDLMGRTTSIISEHWQENIQGFDDIGNLLSRTVQDKCGAYQENFSYDDLYQLKSEAGLKDHQYSYDSLFNRVEEDGGAIEVNELNQIRTKNNAAYEYDLDGHLIALTHNNSKKEFKYDALDRLIFYRDEKGSAEYSYDFSHRRLRKKIFDSEGNIISEEKYLYLENKEIGSLTPENRFISFRVLLPNIASENRASVAVELLGKPYAVIHDHNGSIVSLTDIETGEAIHQTRFSAFGCLIEKNTSLDMPWGFSGKRFDEETGFIFFGRRYYHPEDGRWITKDPLGEFDGPNLYAYVQNRPSILIDAYGYMAEDNSFKHAAYGIGLGAFDFMVNMFHDLERGAAYYGSSDLEMSFDGRSIMLDSVAEAQAQRMDKVDDFLADTLSFDKTDPLFQSCRAYTTLTMEVGSLALGGYNIAAGGYRAFKAATASRRVASMPYQALRVAETGLQEISTFSKINKTKQIWSSTKRETSVKNAYRHWKDHGRDFPSLENSKQYVEATREFIFNSPPGTLTKTRVCNGDVVFYHPSSNFFAVMNKQGLPKTMYKPNPIEHKRLTNLDYFYDQ